MMDMLREDSPADRRQLLMFAAKRAHEDLPTSFDYVDMSPAALRGPSLAAIAFAGITVCSVFPRWNSLTMTLLFVS
jgi:hypothetical protein